MEPFAADGAARAHDPAGGAVMTLRRDGGRPLRFTGWALGEAECGAGAAWQSVRLALYACQDGGFVAEINCAAPHPSGPAQPGASWCQALRAPSLDAALQCFEAAMPPLDAGPPPAGGDAMTALFQSAARLCRFAAREQAFRHAVGEFLATLCTDGAPGVSGAGAVMARGGRVAAADAPITSAMSARRWEAARA